ncbi:MAG: ParE family toxin-like protein [Candidatus Binataceae bacterium]
MPLHVKRLAADAYRLFLKDPFHPGLHFKPIHSTEPIYSIRIGLGYRAVGLKPNAGDIVWFWIGSHADYDKLIKGL